MSLCKRLLHEGQETYFNISSDIVPLAFSTRFYYWLGKFGGHTIQQHYKLKVCSDGRTVGRVIFSHNLPEDNWRNNIIFIKIPAL